VGTLQRQKLRHPGADLHQGQPGEFACHITVDGIQLRLRQILVKGDNPIADKARASDENG
jgi:hypothetical protein